MSPLFVTLTTINSPTDSVAKLADRLTEYGGTLVVAGDRKGPIQYEAELLGANVKFLSLADQLDGPFELSRKLPTGHYCRKNIAYLHAIAQGATCIYETDDDNAPLPTWQPRHEYIDNAGIIPPLDFEAFSGTWNLEPGTRNIADKTRWINVYKYFTDALIWPRGLPLDEIHNAVPQTSFSPSAVSMRAPIQQGLVNNSPDVDAIWRLVLDRNFSFEDRTSVYLGARNWCPFNSQSTWWWPIAYPLLYLPSYCSFRMCDIWRSFIAQRCLWDLGVGVVFHSAEVHQERNEHDLIRDFREEFPGYERNKDFVRVLERLELHSGEQEISQNLRVCYEALINAGFFPPEEMKLLDAWLAALREHRTAKNAA